MHAPAVEGGDAALLEDVEYENGPADAAARPNLLSPRKGCPSAWAPS
jgi:hypothetical protein